VTGNKAQIEYWNGPTGEKWARHNSETDRGLAEAANAVLKLAGARSGERVLDIGCGAGITSFSLAELVGPSGHVTGVDVSRPLLALARSRAQGGNIEFIEADAALYPFQPEFDLIFSRFGVMFFDVPAAAFANMRTALKPGSRIAFVCWRTPPENPWASAPLLAAKPFLPEQPPPDPLAPGPFAFADAKRVEDILSRGGFSDIRIEKLDTVMTLGDDLGLAASQMLQIGPLSRAVGDVDDATRAAIARAVHGALAKFVRPDGEIAPPAACWLVAAKALP